MVMRTLMISTGMVALLFGGAGEAPAQEDAARAILETLRSE